MARAALGLGVRDLAAAAEVAPSTVSRFESENGGLQVRTLERIQKVFEKRGVIFIAADANGGPGVRLKK
jgi:transcriptional regulator with XRE-family HTH domain